MSGAISAQSPVSASLRVLISTARRRRSNLQWSCNVQVCVVCCLRLVPGTSEHTSFVDHGVYLLYDALNAVNSFTAVFAVLSQKYFIQPSPAAHSRYLLGLLVHFHFQRAVGMILSIHIV